VERRSVLACAVYTRKLKDRELSSIRSGSGGHRSEARFLCPCHLSFRSKRCFTCKTAEGLERRPMGYLVGEK
jgi:hypothetical protein